MDEYRLLHQNQKFVFLSSPLDGDFDARVLRVDLEGWRTMLQGCVVVIEDQPGIDNAVVGWFEHGDSIAFVPVALVGIVKRFCRLDLVPWRRLYVLGQYGLTGRPARLFGHARFDGPMRSCIWRKRAMR